MGQFGSNLAGVVLVWSPSRIVSDESAHKPRWLPWLKIEMLPKKSLKTFSSETAWPIGNKRSLGGPLSEFYPMTLPAKSVDIVLTQRHMGKMFKNLL